MLALVFLLGAALPAAAQSDVHAAEVFAGYSYLSVSGVGVPRGWHASLAGNLNSWFGVVGEFSGHYKDISGVSASAHTFTVGPRFAYRRDRINPFAHATFGAVRVGASFAGSSTSDTAFGTTIGFGVDVKATDRIALRAAQFDYLMTRVDGETQHSIRLSAGIVFRIGRK